MVTIRSLSRHEILANLELCTGSGLVSSCPPLPISLLVLISRARNDLTESAFYKATALVDLVRVDAHDARLIQTRLTSTRNLQRLHLLLVPL
jgi:hypothetical protein